MAIHETVIGIDEVGRGALAGPVVVAAAMITCSQKEFARRAARAKLGPLKDSKKLSAAQRERWYAYFVTHPKITFAVARVYPRQIEKRNISGAANLAALRAYKKLGAGAGGGVNNKSHEILLDAGLFLGNGKLKKENPLRTKSIVKGDEKIAAIAVASIIAKVHRDRFMVKLAKQYPAYGFDIHKGYGTKMHRDALLKIGFCEIHRRSFVTGFLPTALGTP